MLRAVFLVTVATLLLAGCEERPARVAPKDPAARVAAAVETPMMPDADDAADDPAIWVSPSEPTRSLVIGTNKRRGLVVYDLTGKELSRRDDGRLNNVDIRQGVTIGGFNGDLVAATNRDKKSVDLYGFDGAVAALTPLLSIPTGFNDPYGLCLYRNAVSGELYVFANNSDDGLVRQWRVTASGSVLGAEQVRNFGVGSQAEGCAADDENGVVFVAEEDVGFYAYEADPADAAKNGNARVVIDTTSGAGHLTADAEGVAILKSSDGGGYLIVSSQGSNSYNVYDRVPPYTFRGAFQIGPTTPEAGIDGAEETDGIEVTGAALSGTFAEGLFVAQDGFNYEGVGEDRRTNQNFKLVPWAQIRAALKLAGPPIPATN